MILDLILLTAFCAVLFAVVVKGVFVVSDYLIRSYLSSSKTQQSQIQGRERHMPLFSVNGIPANPVFEFNQIDYSSDNYHENRSVW